jgi:hypothetical protein
MNIKQNIKHIGVYKMPNRIYNTKGYTAYYLSWYKLSIPVCLGQYIPKSKRYKISYNGYKVLLVIY